MTYYFIAVVTMHLVEKRITETAQETKQNKCDDTTLGDTHRRSLLLKKKMVRRSIIAI